MPDSQNYATVRTESLTVPYDSVKQEPRLEMAQEPYYLSEVEYVYIKNGDSKALLTGITIFLTSIGYLLVLLSKLFTITFTQSKIIIEEWEWHVVWISALLGLILCGLGKWILPSEKTRVIKDIEKHFESNRPTRQLPRR